MISSRSSPGSSSWAATRAVFRFHAGAGVRVGLRNSVAGTIVTLFVGAIAPNPLGLLRALARSLAAADTSSWALYLMAVLAAALARHAAPQVAAGQSGWFGSLPTGAAVRQRATTGALVLVQAPALIFALGCAVWVGLDAEARLAPLKLAAVIPLAIAAALVARPATTRRSRTRWRSLTGLPQRIAWRAISWRAIPPLVAAALPLAAAWFYRTNNDLSAGASTTAARLGGIVALVVALGGLANVLHGRRPVWSWQRSLPWSSGTRVLHDAAALGAGVIPVLIVVLWMDIAAAIAVAALVPLLALLAAAAIRRAGTRLSAAAGELSLFGALVVTALAVLPPTILAFVALTPLAARFAAWRDRTRPVSRWLELHHSVEGDGRSWSAR